RPQAGQDACSARARAQMHSLAPASSAFSTTAPARCGSSTSKLIPSWHDKHPLTCDNDTTDSWEDGWTRQPPLYQGSLHFLVQHADRNVKQSRSLHKLTFRHRGSLPSRNTGQIQLYGANSGRYVTQCRHDVLSRSLDPGLSARSRWESSWR